MLVDFPLQVLLFVIDHPKWTTLTLLALILLKMTLPKMEWHRRLAQVILLPVGFWVIARCAINPGYLAKYRRT